MDFGNVSWVGVILAGIVFFAIGGVYYGPLFGERWTRESGISPEQARQSNLPLVFAAAFVLELIAAIGLALVIGEDATPVEGLVNGLLLNLLLVLPVLGVMSVFERKTWNLFAINAGYNLVGFAAMGLILGVFQ